ncbi:hypothetical protein Hanom_Chr00s000496g01646631 [Helianthus anomalus]
MLRSLTSVFVYWDAERNFYRLSEVGESFKSDRDAIEYHHERGPSMVYNPENVAPFVDSDVFAMRHMKWFVGSRRNNFFCGFSVHGARKKAQCNYLRKRYAAEILLSPVNKYSDEIRRQLAFV